MNPDSAESNDFRAHGVQLAAASYATRADTASDRVVNGVPLRERLDGYNALDDGTVVNHNLVHPDYMGNIQHLWWAADYTVLDGATLPEAYLHNGSLVYGAFSTLEFEAGALSAAGGGRRYFPPGGTIYRHTRADTNEMYFPDGTDWGEPRRAPFMSLDAHATAYDLAPPGAWSAEEALAAHARGQLALGDRSGSNDGRTYSVDPDQAKAQDRYVGREEYAAQQVATAWLALVLGDLEPGPPAVDDSTYAVPGQPGERSTVPPPVGRVSP